MEDEMIDLYEIAESNDDWIHSIEGVEEVFDPETETTSTVLKLSQCSLNQGAFFIILWLLTQTLWN